MNIQEVRRIVGTIQGRLFKKSNAYSIGALKSQFRGTGLQFKEHQVYAMGDDVRFIDWKLLAKMNTPYVKTFEEERNVEIAVIVDASPTMFMGYDGISKFQAAIEILCLLYLLADEAKDFIHAIIVTDKVVSIEKSMGEAGIARLVKTLEKLDLIDSKGNIKIKHQWPESNPEFDRGKEIIKHLKRQREVVVLSDLNDFSEDSALSKVLYKRNLHIFRVKCPLDDASQVPFSLMVNRLGFGKLSGVLDFEARLNKENQHKKIKQIDVSRPYLDQFVMEML